jgi:hypothetical protein
MLRKLCLIGAVVVTSLILPVQADAGSAVGSLILPVQADTGSDVPRTNTFGKYVHYGRTNTGLKHVYRGIGSTFHTNPGGKYVYPGYSAWRPGR